MRWPWSKPEERQSGGGFSDAIVSALEARAAATIADVSSTAAIEAASGQLACALASAEVQGPIWVRAAVSPEWLSVVGRSLIRQGEALSVIGMRGDGAVTLTPAAQWTFEGGPPRDDADEESWLCRATVYGPSSSTTRLLPRDQLIFLRWGSSPGERYRGRGPTSWAHLTARLQGEVERSLGDEAAGPVAQLVAIPADGGDGDEDTDPLAKLKADLSSARGRAMLVETVASAWGEGKSAAPMADWKANRLGPQPPEALVSIANDSFARMLAACGCPPSLFLDSDGTSQREGLRRWFQGTVMPLARLLSHELSMRLEADVTLKFDNYPLDLQGRAAAFQKLVAGGVAVNEALATSGLLIDAE